MIYADFLEEPEFGALVAMLKAHYSDVRFGQQGDSWIWVESEDMKVEIDTFSAMRFQVKSPSKSHRLVVQILALLQQHYKLYIYPESELEAHED